MSNESLMKACDMKVDQSSPQPPANTESLYNMLLKARDISSFIKEHSDLFQSTDLSIYLAYLCAKYELKNAKVIEDSGINGDYFYQILSGKRKPSRDKTIRLAFGMKLDIKETQRLLNCSGASELYPRNRRDAIILFALEHRISIYETNDFLYELSEPLL